MGFHDERGNWITEENGVVKVTVDYFDYLFSTTGPTEFDSFPVSTVSSLGSDCFQDYKILGIISAMHSHNLIS